MKTVFKKIIVSIMTAEARLVLARHRPRIVAITGSVGKTTTKDAVYAVVSAAFSTRKSEKSLNSDIGVPLAILGLENAWSNPFKWVMNIIRGLVVIVRPYEEWLVLEVGADHPGDIGAIARWLKPEIAIITGVPEIPAHLEYFSSPEAVVQEKLSLARFVATGGSIILNGDDDRLMQEEGKFDGKKTFTYGTNEKATLTATHIGIAYRNEVPTGMQFRIDHKGSSIPVAVSGALGTPRVYAALAGLSVANVIGIDILTAVDGLRGWVPAPGRMRILEGVNGSIIIDDSYNSSPAAALSALDALAAVEAKRRIAILGDMRELGAHSMEAHQLVGRRAAGVVDILVTVGEESHALADSARENGLKADHVREYGYGASVQVGKDYAAELRAGDVVLVKGSQNRIRLERTVRGLLAHPEHAADLLVRQEGEWDAI